MRWPFWLPLLLVAVLYLVLPGHALAPLAGLPLDAASLIVLACLGILFFGWAPARPSPLDRYLLIALLVLGAGKLATHALSLDYGLRASYHTSIPNGPVSDRPERSLHYPGADATRLDRRLDFDARNLPVYFWNELRFDFYLPGQPSRYELPLSARWSGFLYVPEAGPYTFRLTAQGPAELTVGDTRLALDGAGTQTATAVLEAGTRPFAANYTRPPSGAVQFEAAWDRGGAFAPLSAPYLVAESPSPARWAAAEAGRWLALLLTALYVATLGVLGWRLGRDWWARRPVAAAPARGRRQLEAPAPITSSVGWLERPLLALGLLIGLAWALWEARPYYGLTVVLNGGGDDWQRYESYARDIALNGLLQLQGRPLGDALPFDAQPAYPYFLAALHLLAGEPLYGPVLVQFVLLPVEAVLVYYIARLLFGRPAATAGALLFTALAAFDMKLTASTLLNENLYQFALPVAALAALRLIQRPNRVLALVAGLLLALAVIARYTALLWVPFVVAAVTLELARAVGRQRAAGPMALFLAGTVLGLGLVPLRNEVAAGKAIPIPTTAGANLLTWRGIPPTLDRSQVEVGAWSGLYRALGWTQQSGEAMALENLRQAPLQFLGMSTYFVAYAVGLHDVDLGSAGRGPARLEFVPLVALYLFAWTAWRETGRARCWLVHGFVLTHLAIVAAFGINAYAPRLILPMYVLLPTVAGFGAVLAWRLAATRLPGFAPTAKAPAPARRRG